MTAILGLSETATVRRKARGLNRRFEPWGVWLVAIIPALVIVSFVVAVLLFWIFSIIPWWGMISGFFIIAWVVLWGAVIYDLLHRADVSVLQVAVWIGIVVLFPLLGALAYYVTRPAASKIRYRGEEIG